MVFTSWFRSSTVDWLEYAGGNTTYENLYVAPNKKNIMPTLDLYLNDVWYNNWSDLKGHRQTKYWFTRPDPFLSTKLMILVCALNFSPAMAGGKKHLTVAKLCNDEECQLCCEGGSEESPIHIFSECVAMATTRQGLLNDPYLSQQVGRTSLCQVSELVFVDSICDLIDKDQN